MMEDEIQYRHSTATRSPSKYISQAFGFLKTFDEETFNTSNGTIENHSSTCHYAGQKNGYVRTADKEDSVIEDIQEAQEEAVDEPRSDTEFTKGADVEDVNVKHDEVLSEQKPEANNKDDILEDQIVKQSNIISEQKSVSSNIDGISKVIEFNSVYEVTDDALQELEANLNEDKAKLCENEAKLSENSKIANDFGDHSGSVTDENENGQKVRLSVIVDGEEVELRQSSADKRAFRQPTWKVNQKVVSEVFGFLQDENGNTESVFSEDSGFSDSKVTDCLTDNDYKQRGIEVEGQLTDSTTDHTDNHSDKLSNGTNIDSSLTKKDYGNSRDLVGELRNIKRRGRHKQSDHSESGNDDDDDGCSSDEDKGMA